MKFERQHYSSFKDFKSVVPVLMIALVFGGCSAMDRHQAGGYYSGTMKVGERKTVEHYDPNGPIGVGALLIGPADAFVTFVYNPIDFVSSFFLETLLLPVDMYYRDEFLQRDRLERARAMKQLNYSISTYGYGYMSEASPISDAILKKKPLEQIRETLRQTPDVNHEDEFGYTALDYAIASDNLEVVRLLVETFHSPIRVATVLEAMQYNMLAPRVLEYLLSQGLDPNLRRTDGETLLKYSTCQDNSMVRMLVANGADVNAKDDQGETAFMKAIRCDDAELVALYLDHGAKIKTEDTKGRSALFYASEKSLPLLLKAGLDINAADVEGRTPLYVALNLIYSKPERMAPRVGALLHAGADPNRADNTGETPLISAAINAFEGETLVGYEEAVAMLLAAGADPNVQDASGMTALMYAVRRGAGKITKELVSAGAFSEIYDYHSKKALDHAERASERSFLIELRKNRTRIISPPKILDPESVISFEAEVMLETPPEIWATLEFLDARGRVLFGEPQKVPVKEGIVSVSFDAEEELRKRHIWHDRIANVQVVLEWDKMK